MLHETDLSRADLNLLVLFEAVMEERHVGRAALRLSLSPSAVSHGLGRLRRLLGDPLFIRTPRGVTPTDRAVQLTAPIAEVLAGVRGVLASVAPFDPATSRRRFVLGAPDGVSAVIAPPLLARLRSVAPNVDLGVRQLLPVEGETNPVRAWRGAFDDLDARTLDIAVIPVDEIPARFHRQAVFEEDFVAAVRRGHPAAGGLDLDAYCALPHLVVSGTGDPYGFVDVVLAREGRARRIALTAPNFMFALALVAESDLVCALPRRFAAMHGPRFDVVGLEPPLPLGRFRLNAAVPLPALADAGLAWMLDQLAEGRQR
ncbi:MULTISPECIES: LysR family transcriptional regulator [unclassified Phenylobacterium]|jgi:DNA-binding transcriptional LysR family regulator|uniref:LysR family transcriptional regulator n=1 Tax=unclassified Phenylobacterium TaxID=2640670 RepID=UPI00083AAEC8|nr:MULTISPECIES: LysR family transcriptional regulator [unclassified Phenylobacterium]